MSDLPLGGVRVISFEQFGAAPYCTMLLADLGAEVLKVETAEGEAARRMAPLSLGEGDSLYFQTFNMNKRSLVLDLRRPEDREALHRLVRTSHVVLNNLRGNQPAKLGLDYAALGPVNRAVVCGHISAYGRTGSRADWPGYDFLMQAEAGFMLMTGEPGALPARVGLSMVDYMTGTMMAVGLLSALRAADQTGVGRDVDVTLFDAAVHQLAYQAAWSLNAGIDTPRQPRSAHPSATPVQLYRAADGWLYVCCMTERFWEILLDRIGNPELGQDPRFHNMAARRENRDELTEALDAVLGRRSVDDWMATLGGHIPVAPVRDLGQALANPFVREAGMIAEVAHPGGSTLQMLANPIRLSGSRLPQRAAPALDADGPLLRAIPAGDN